MQYRRTLSKDAKLYLIIQNLFILSTALSSTFVNVFMWKLTSDFRVIGIYNIITFLTAPITFIMSGKIARKRGISFCTVTGLIFFMLFYVITLVQKEKIINYLYFAGAFFGLGSGFYWFGNNSLIYYYTDINNRGYFMGISSALNAVMTTIGPIASGYIIATKSSYAGYYVVFFISFLLFLVAIILSLFLSKVKIKGQFNLKHILFKDKNKNWDRIMAGIFFIGLRDGTINYITTILIFLVLKSELKVGQFTTITSILAIVSSYIIGKIINRRNRMKLLIIGSVISFISTVVLVTWTNFYGVLANGVLLAIFTCVWAIPIGIITYEVAGQLSEKNNNLSDYVIVKEIPLNVGRTFGILMYLILGMYIGNEMLIKITLPILSFMLIINYFIVKDIKRTTKN